MKWDRVHMFVKQFAKRTFTGIMTTHCRQQHLPSLAIPINFNQFSGRAFFHFSLFAICAQLPEENNLFGANSWIAIAEKLQSSAVQLTGCTNVQRHWVDRCECAQLINCPSESSISAWGQHWAGPTCPCREIELMGMPLLNAVASVVLSQLRKLGRSHLFGVFWCCP